MNALLRRLRRTSRTILFRPIYAAHASEVEKFNALSPSWWDPKQNPLISMNETRMQFIQTNVAQYLRAEPQAPSTPLQLPLQGLRALDIGCGGGLLSESLTRLGCHTIGLDPSQALIEVAQQHAESHLTQHVLARLQYRVGTVQELSSDENKFDVVCCLEVVEHVPDPNQFLSAAVDCLRPGGLLFVSTINKTYKSFLITILGAEYVAALLPRGTHDWNAYLSPAQVGTMVADRSEELQVRGMVLPPNQLVRSYLCGANWPWKLHPTDTDVNWIASYRRKA